MSLLALSDQFCELRMGIHQAKYLLDDLSEYGVDIHDSHSDAERYRAYRSLLEDVLIRVVAQAEAFGEALEGERRNP